MKSPYNAMMKNGDKLQSAHPPDPTQYLHQLSFEQEASHTKYERYPQSKSKLSKANTGTKIFNNRQAQGLQWVNEISQWVNTSTTDVHNQSLNLSHSRDKKQKKVLSPSPSTHLTQNPKVIQTWISLKRADNDHKFLSMAQLCHRFTFLNQHGSHPEYFSQEQEGYAGKGKVHHPVNIQLKLQSNQDYISEKLRTNYRFMKNKDTGIVRLPLLQREQGENESVPHNQYINTVLKLISKSGSKRIIRSESPRPKGQKEGKLKANSSFAHKKQEKQKINWKKSQRYGLELDQPQPLTYSPSHPKKAPRKQTTFSIRPQLLQQMKQSSRSRMERVSKSLQQCLILSKK